MCNRLLIEVGSFDGTDSLKKFYNDGYKVYTFEPNTDLFKDLFERTKYLKDYTVINKAVSLTNGRQKFNICRSGGASSLLTFKSNKELRKHWSSVRTDIQYSGISYDVDTIRLDTFIEENSLQNTKIDLLHIDAQGVDLDVLKSLGKYLKNVSEGVLETAFSSDKTIYVEQCENILANVI
jgi:FkbM family methyltransferase